MNDMPQKPVLMIEAPTLSPTKPPIEPIIGTYTLTLIQLPLTLNKPLTPVTPDSLYPTIGALMFWGPIYYSKNKEPSK